jgi:hypothetical protein
MVPLLGGLFSSLDLGRGMYPSAFFVENRETFWEQIPGLKLDPGEK